MLSISRLLVYLGSPFRPFLANKNEFTWGKWILSCMELEGGVLCTFSEHLPPISIKYTPSLFVIFKLLNNRGHYTIALPPVRWIQFYADDYTVLPIIGTISRITVVDPAATMWCCEGTVCRVELHDELCTVNLKPNAEWNFTMNSAKWTPIKIWTNDSCGNW